MALKVITPPKAQLARGSTRVMDRRFFPRTLFAAGSDGVARGGAIVTAMVNTSGVLAARWKGATAAKIPNADGPYMRSNFLTPVATDKPGTGDADARVKRWLATVAFSAAANPTKDVGLRVDWTGNGEALDHRGNFMLDGFRSGVGVLLIGGVPRFIVKAEGTVPPQENVALDWPVALDTWCEVEFRIFDATATDFARLDLYLGGTLALSRAWDGGALSLPVPSGASNFGGFSYGAMSALDGPSLYVARWQEIIGAADAGTY